MRKKKPLHKYFREYTEKEITEIKKNHCAGCPHYGYSRDKKQYQDDKLHSRDCEFLEHEGHRRIIRPEFCPYNGNGIEPKKGEFFADFDIYCPRCKHCKVTTSHMPCDKCLQHVTVTGSTKPLMYESKES